MKAESLVESRRRWWLPIISVAVYCLLPTAASFTSGAEAPVADASGPQTRAETLAAQSRGESVAHRWDEALRIAEEAVAADGASASALLARGIARAGKGDLEAAVDDFDAVTRQEGGMPTLVALRAEAHLQRAKAHYSRGNYLPAIDSCYFSLLEKISFDAHFQRGLAYLARHEYEKAIRSFEQSLKINAKSAAAWSHAGFAHGGLGRFDQCIRDQENAIKLDPKLAIAYERRGAALAAKDKLPDAMKDIEKAIELDPKLGEALCDRATILRMGGDLVRAAKDADAAIAASPGLARAHLERGLIWATGRDADMDKARDCIEEAVRLDPRSPDALCALGQCHIAGRNYEAAIAEFSQAIEFDPKLIAAYAGRAQAYKRHGSMDAYRQDAAKIKELQATADPKNKNKPKPATDEPEPFRVESKPVAPARHAEAVAAARKIDRFVAANYAKHDVTPMPPASDATFMRRIYLDVAGRIPTLKETTAFLKSSDPDKRTKLIDELLGSDDYASHFFNFWADILPFRDKPFPARLENGLPYRQWIMQSLAENEPWDKIVYAMLASEGLPYDVPPTLYLQRYRYMPLDTVNDTVRVFLGTRVGCAQCHDHPFDKWKQKQFYQAAAFFSATRMEAGTGVDGDRLKKELATLEVEEEDRREIDRELGRVLFIATKVLSDEPDSKIRLPKNYAYKDAKPGELVEPKTLFGSDAMLQPGEAPRKAFARWLTAKDNPRFALTIANRLWKKVFGIGQIEPVDDMTDGTVAENPELMAFLVTEMTRLDFDMKEYLRILFNTDTYQRKAFDREATSGTPYHFPGPVLRRMTAEQAWDSFLTLAAAEATYRDVPAELYKSAFAIDLTKTTVWEVHEAQQKVWQLDRMRKKAEEKYRYKDLLLARASELPSPLPPDHFLRMFGQSDRELIATSSTQGSVPQVLFMYNGQITHMLLEKNSTIYNNIARTKSISDGVKTAFLTILSREPDAEELAAALAEVKSDGPAGYGNVVWALVNTREFLFVK